MWPMIANMILGIIQGKNSQAGNIAKSAMGLIGNSAKSTNKNMPEPQVIGG